CRGRSGSDARAFRDDRERDPRNRRERDPRRRGALQRGTLRRTHWRPRRHRPLGYALAARMCERFGRGRFDLGPRRHRRPLERATPTGDARRRARARTRYRPKSRKREGVPTGRTACRGRPMNLAIVGCGAVGRAVCDLAESYGHRITALADSTSAVTDAAGIDVETALERKIRDGTVGSADPERALDAEYDVLVEATPTTLDDAEPGFSHVLGALERDRHVVLANKGPVAERYDDLRSAERDSAGRVLFEATVGGAIPVLS